jgi:hypothetical protein
MDKTIPQARPDFNDFSATRTAAAELDTSVFDFIKANLRTTNNKKDFVLITDVYDRYIKQTENTISRNALTRKIKKIHPALSIRQTKIDGTPAMIFSGCRWLNEREIDRGYVIALDLLNDPNLYIETIKEFSDGSIEILLNSKKPRKFVTEAIYG